MPPADEVRSVSVFDVVTSDNTVTVLPVEFGVGRRDRAVRVLSVHYTVTQWDDAFGPAFKQWAAALSEDPEVERIAPVGGIAVNIGLSSLYGWVFEAEHQQHFNQADGLGKLIQKTHHMELHGVLRPYRQRVVFWNEVGGAAQFRCEILYEPATRLADEDLRSIDRTHGAVRRT